MNNAAKEAPPIPICSDGTDDEREALARFEEDALITRPPSDDEISEAFPDTGL
ncbi:MAG TPA: hypothetical protein VMF32_00275 [Xanthobacteraceae bacterium]|nr:hypothetical protein [Xanthobacteraceae bacterium]